MSKNYEDDVTAPVTSMITSAVASRLRAADRTSPPASVPTPNVPLTPTVRQCVEINVGGALPESADFSYLRPGRLPSIMSLNDNGEVLDWGDRAPYAEQPTFAVYDFFARAFNTTPASPLSNSATASEGEANVTLSEAAASSAATNGNQRIVCGFIIEVSIDFNVPPGAFDMAITGTFEDGSAFTWANIQLIQKGQGMSQFLVIPSKTLQNRTFPCCVLLRNDFKVVLGGTSIALTAAAAPNDATAIVPTAGIQFPDADVTFVFANVPDGMHFRVQTLSPTSKYANVALAAFEAQLAIGQ